ncbi:MAG: hypothetical protein ACPL3E_00195 [Minisyncoccia bacterium]
MNENPSNFEKEKPNNQEVQSYLEAFKEWQLLFSKLNDFFKGRKILEILDNIHFYKIADERLKEKANKINAPLPDEFLLDAAVKYLKIIALEIKEKNKENESNEDN